MISTLSAVAEEDVNDEQKAYLGIALAFRAQFYLDLVRLFEAKECTGSQVKNYTIPENIKGLACCIVTENTTEEQSKSNPRATVDEVYDQVIFPDLERAERMLGRLHPYGEDHARPERRIRYQRPCMARAAAPQV